MILQETRRRQVSPEAPPTSAWRERPLADIGRVALKQPDRAESRFLSDRWMLGKRDGWRRQRRSEVKGGWFGGRGGSHLPLPVELQRVQDGGNFLPQVPQVNGIVR